MVIVGIGASAVDILDRIRWVREYWDTLRPYSETGGYVNFLGDEGQERIKATYRENDERLVALKNTYNPANLFHLNQNIPPKK